MAEIDSIKKKIHALLQKTTGNGCTEAEAMLAAAKAGEMMDHYQLQMTDIQIVNEKCVQIKVETDGVNRQPIDLCVVALARYCDIKVWFSKGRIQKDPVRDENGNWTTNSRGKYKFTRTTVSSSYGVFGLKQDTEVFEYLFGIIKNMMAVELDIFQTTDTYVDACSNFGGAKGGKLSATLSFQQGMASGISHQLDKMKEARRERQESAGRDLVILKHALVEEEFDKTSVNLSKNYTRRRSGNYSAKSKGFTAGRKMNLNGGIRSGAANNAMIG